MKIQFKLKCKKTVGLPPPTVDSYYKIYFPASEQEKTEGIIDWLGSGDLEARAYIEPEDILRAEEFLSDWLRLKRKEEEYIPPHVATDVVEKTVYSTIYHEMKFVADYTLMSFAEIRQIDVLQFWRYYRDAVIYRAKTSEGGKEFLERAYNSVQTKPDMAAIAELIKQQ